MTTKPTAKQDSREKVASKLNGLPYVDKRNGLHIDLDKIADYCIKYRNDGIKQAMERIKNNWTLKAFEKIESLRIIETCDQILKG